MDFQKFLKLEEEKAKKAKLFEAPDDDLDLDLEMDDDLDIDDDFGLDDEEDIDIEIDAEEEELDTSMEVEQVPQGSFSERLQTLGKGWSFSAHFDGSANTQKWEMTLKGNKDERVDSTGPTWGKTLGVLIAQARNKGINI